MSVIRISIDTDANATYVTLSDRPVAKTIELNPSVLVDVDDRDAAVGIELLDPTTPIPLRELTTRFGVSAELAAEIAATLPRVS